MCSPECLETPHAPSRSSGKRGDEGELALHFHFEQTLLPDTHALVYPKRIQGQRRCQAVLTDSVNPKHWGEQQNRNPSVNLLSHSTLR